MKRLWALASLVFLTSPPALAQSPQLDPSFCQQLVRHVPDADVAYRAGVDVHGRAVVPADLESEQPFALPETISIPLTAQLAQFLAIDMSSFPFNSLKGSDINLGTLTVQKDKVFLDGKPLTSPQQENLAVLCLKPTSR